MAGLYYILPSFIVTLQAYLDLMTKNVFQICELRISIYLL